MDFEFTADQRQMQASIQGLLNDRYGSARSREIAESRGFDDDLWRALADAGVFSLLVPEAQGGLGLGPVDAVLLLEEFGRALAPSPVVETMLAADLIGRFGTAAQRERYLPLIVDGTLRATIAIAEADAGFDPAEIELRADPRDGGCVLRGAKIMVPNLDGTGLLLVVALAGDRPGVALCDGDAPGLARRDQVTLDRACRHHAVDFADVPAAMLGDAAEPDAVARLFDLCAAAAAAQMAGIAVRALDESVAYAAQREQFGKPIGSFQAIKHKCADMATAVEGARSAAYHAALALSDATTAAKPSSIAKAFAGEAARLVCNHAIQIHGGVGFTWELGLHLWLRRARTLEASHGDIAWHQERVLAQSLLELGIGG
jgi:alkylation response protein AidB-like acyl-CoA dehydrogenase